MSTLTPEQVLSVREKIAALRKALDELESTLPDPDPSTHAEVEMTRDVQDLLNRVPPDEVKRLSGLVPQLADANRKPPPAKRQRKPKQ